MSARGAKNDQHNQINMNIQLSDHFNTARLLRFTLPSIVMNIFTSLYSIVDGFFVSNFVGKTPFAAVNFIMPLLIILGCTGFMFGAGGSALIALYLGEGRREQANRTFTMVAAATFALSATLSILGLVFLEPIVRLMGASEAMMDDCLLYGRIILAVNPFYALQFLFQCLFITAEKPKLGLLVTVMAGVTNMVLDALLVAVFGWGLAGAALATALSQIVGGLVPIVYFIRPNTSLLRFARFRLDGRALARAAGNVSTEHMSNNSKSLIGMIYNMQLMRYAGEDGVAAYGVLMYVSMIFQAVFIGYAVGVAPVISFHYGAGHKDELSGLLARSVRLIGGFSVAMFLAGELAGRPLSMLFVGYDAELLAMTARAFAIFSFCFLFSGLAIFGSSFFTALNDGLTSALISFLRTLVFQVLAVLLLPLALGLTGVWLSIVVAEVMAVTVTAAFVIARRGKYGYALPGMKKKG